MDFIFLFKIVGTIIFALILGMLSSIPVGAIQLEVIKKSIHGHVKPAIATAIGSATSDFIYGILTLLGFGTFLFHQDFQILLYALGVAVISFLIYRTIKERQYMLHTEQQKKYKKRLSFLTGLSIAATNPGMIIWWVIGYKLYIDFKIIQNPSIYIKSLFIISSCIGLGGYLIILAITLHKVKDSFSEKFLYRTNNILIILLSILTLYFIVKLICLISNIPISF